MLGFWARRVTDIRIHEWIHEWTGKPKCQAAVSGTRDLRSEYFVFFSGSLFPLHHRCTKNCYRSLRTGGHSPPLSSAVGKVPGDAEYVILYVHAMESVCP